MGEKRVFKMSQIEYAQCNTTNLVFDAIVRYGCTLDPTLPYTVIFLNSGEIQLEQEKP